MKALALTVVIATLLALAGCGNLDTPLCGYPDSYLQGGESTTP